jgi:hypothetical protein
MRTVQTLVLRLWVDTDEPQALRGAVRCVTEEQEHPFADEQALLSLLRQMAGRASVEVEPVETSQNQERKMIP